jgi:hypothetical protein
MDLLTYLDEHFGGPKIAPTVRNLITLPRLASFTFVRITVCLWGLSSVLFFMVCVNVNVSRREARNRQLQRF